MFILLLLSITNRILIKVQKKVTPFMSSEEIQDQLNQQFFIFR